MTKKKQHHRSPMKKKKKQHKRSYKAVRSYSSSFMNLPTDLVHNIFSRLQVKFMWPCKLVCKAWFNILSSPDFMSYYSNRTPFTTLVMGPYERRVTTTRPCHAISFVEINPEDGNDWIRTTFKLKLPLYLCSTYSFLRIEGSSNGLFCFRIHKGSTLNLEVIYIYNPSTGEGNVLPEHTFEPYDQTRYRVSLSYLFCFSPSTYNFKVVKFVRQISIIGLKEKVQQCEIFTIGVDHKWRQLEHPFTVGYPIDRAVLNGYVCWLDRDEKKNPTTTNIVCFDFGEEKVGRVPHPRGVVLNDKDMSLAVLNRRRLSLVDCSNPVHYILWTMEKYGVAESWTKIVVLRRGLPRLLSDRGSAMLRKGNVLFELVVREHLLWYSSNQKEYTIFKVSGDVDWFVKYVLEFDSLG